MELEHHRLRIRENFCLTPTGATTVNEEYKDSDPPSDYDWVIADIGLNAINEECVLAFFHIGKGDCLYALFNISLIFVLPRCAVLSCFLPPFLFIYFGI